MHKTQTHAPYMQIANLVFGTDIFYQNNPYYLQR